MAPHYYIRIQDRGTCGYQTVYQPCCPERSLPRKAIRISPITFYWVGSAIALYNDIVSAIDQGEVTGLVLLGLRPALDTVDNTSLLSVLESRFLVTGQSLAWLRSYLTELDGPCTVVYYLVHSHFPDTINIRYPPGIWYLPWPNNVYQLCREYNSHFSTHNVQYHLFADNTPSYVSGFGAPCNISVAPVWFCVQCGRGLWPCPWLIFTGPGAVGRSASVTFGPVLARCTGYMCDSY